jgi:hypothetical protein
VQGIDRISGKYFGYLNGWLGLVYLGKILQDPKSSTSIHFCIRIISLVSLPPNMDPSIAY